MRAVRASPRGHAAAAPPSSVMNSRRLIRSYPAAAHHGGAGSAGGISSGIEGIRLDRRAKHHIEYRFADGKEDAFAEIAAELVQLRLDDIVAEGTAAIRAAPPPLQIQRYGATTILAHFFGYHESFVQGNGVPGGSYEVFGVRR